jgi:signal transduction histidine kinase
MELNNFTKPIQKSDIKLLIVDDRDDNLFSIESIFEKDGYNIIKANSGRAALKVLLQQQDFSLILMDVQMPDLNGFETAAIIYEREKLRSIPIIFITAHNYGDEYLFKGYRTGGVDYIYKPINPNLLRAKVGVFVELYRKNQQLVEHEKRLLAINKSLQKEIEERKASEEKVKALNSKLVENNANLKAVNEELDRFAYVASHDLQEPLRKIMVFSDKIQTTNKLDGETDRYFNKIVNASKRMQSLINDLLTFSRHSTSSSDFREVDLNLLWKEVIIEFEHEIERTQAHIELEELPKISAIPGLIRQLFHNILSNALKFRKKSATPVITVRAEKMRKTFRLLGNGATAGNFYKILVSDNGIGFDDKYADEIFLVFKRLHSHHEYEGTGVGLSICKKIVEKHNGFITAESKPDQGATFIIGLPEKQPNQEPLIIPPVTDTQPNGLSEQAANPN